MEQAYPTYNQAGPSNYAGAYAPNSRPSFQSSSNRGRGYKNAQAFPHPQQQPFYSMNPTSGPNPGTPMHMSGNEGLGGMHANGHYGYGSSQPVRHAPTTTAHPSHLYAPHNAYLPQTLAPNGSPLYHPAPPPPHVQGYPAVLQSLPYHPSYAYPNPPNPPNPKIPPDVLSNQAEIPPRNENELNPPAHSQTRSPSRNLQNGEQSTLLPQDSAKDASDVATHPSVDAQQPLSSIALEVEESVETAWRFSPVLTPGSRKLAFNQESEPPPKQGWVISDIRPEDPAEAFGIIISPRANPPPHIVASAMPYSFKPAASPASKKRSDKRSLHRRETRDVAKTEEITVPPVMTTSDQQSGSVTETESRASTSVDAFVPESPWSTATSVSMTAPKTEIGEEAKNKVESAEATAEEIPQSPKSALPEIDQNLPQSSGSTTTAKKSWASLFSAGDPSSSKSLLPKSDLVGLSIPAAQLVNKSREVLGAVRRKELIQLLNNGPRPNGPLPTIKPRGLTNTGNMCFANAVLQTLAYTPPFVRFFTEFQQCGPDPADESYESEAKLIPLVTAVVEFLKEFKPTNQIGEKDEDDFEGIDSFIPSNIYDAMKEKSRFDNMGGGQQEDAEEFFGFFIDTLEEELLALLKSISGSKPKQERDATEEEGWHEVGKKSKAIVTRATKTVSSPMTGFFGGKFRSTLRVPGQKDSAVLEDWRSLKLDIERDDVNSVEAALKYLSHPEHVQVTSVTKGGATVDATQQFLIESLPPILVLHLKRFSYDTKVCDVVKLRKQVDFGPELIIPADIITPAQRSPHPVKYKLFSVVYHHGHSAAGGHYTLDILHHNRNADKSLRPREGWIRIDDELVSDLREQDIFGSERDCAYLLFYRRVAGSYARAGMNS